MHKRTVTIWIIISMGMIASPCFSQYKAYLGAAVGSNANFFQIRPDDPNLYSSTDFILSYLAADFAVGILDEMTFVEGRLAFFEHFLLIDYPDNLLRGAPGVASMTTVHLGLARRLPLVNKRLFLTPRIGLGFSIAGSGGGSASSSTSTSQGQLTWAFDLPQRQPRIIPGAKVGLGLETCFRNGMLLSLRMDYCQGLGKIFDDEIQYSIDGATPVTLRFFSRGSHLPVTLGMMYPISRIWEGKKEL